MDERTVPISLGKGAEFDLVRKFLAAGMRVSGTGALQPHLRVGPGDDCAVVRGEGIAVSVDMSVEGVHFRPDWLEPEEIGYRAAASALSDLAAVAATPIGILVALALRPTETESVALRVMEGAIAAAASVNAVLLGGDVSRTTGPLVVDVVVVGNALRPALRAGALPGDAMWVTGQLGAAAAAVRALGRGATPDSAARLAYARPTPRTAEACWLAGHGVIHALIDLSDGLAGDLGHIAAAGGVQIIIDPARVPVHPAAHAETTRAEDALHLALGGGDDYELCFAAPAGAVEPIAQQFADTFALRLTRIGTVHQGSGVLLRDAQGRLSEMSARGYDHFAESGT